ncbi:unnamed protein product, partial [Amoebophrya sp. A120]
RPEAGHSAFALCVVAQMAGRCVVGPLFEQWPGRLPDRGSTRPFARRRRPGQGRWSGGCIFAPPGHPFRAPPSGSFGVAYADPLIPIGNCRFCVPKKGSP